MKKDKRGVMGIIFFFLILITILAIGFVASIVIGAVDFGSGVITPVMQDLGVVGDTNMTEVSNITFGTTDTIINSLTWMIAFAYVLALIFSIVLVVGYNYNPNPAYIGFYLAFILLLIIASIIISNAYEDIYSGDDELATQLQSQTAMSYLILYSPFVMVLIAFIAGIFLFAGNRTPEGGTV